jgi:hypothetical protein
MKSPRQLDHAPPNSSIARTSQPFLAALLPVESLEVKVPEGGAIQSDLYSGGEQPGQAVAEAN